MDKETDKIGSSLNSKPAKIDIRGIGMPRTSLNSDPGKSIHIHIYVDRVEGISIFPILNLGLLVPQI